MTNYSSLDDQIPLIDRIESMKNAARDGDADAAATLAIDLADCRGYLVALNEQETRVNNQIDPVIQAANERMFEEFLLANGERNEACRGLPIPSIAEVIEWTELAARLGHVGAMVDYVQATNSAEAVAVLARGDVAEFARVRANQVNYNRQAALRCNTSAFVNIAMAPFLSSSPAEQYAFYVLAGWIMTGNQAPGAANFESFSGRQLSYVQEQAALRYAGLFYRRYCQ